MENEINEYYERLKKSCGAYKLNPDTDFVKMLIEGILQNRARYGLDTCPCRLFDGEKEDNKDIVCPCVYREDDLAEYGACYCALYVKDTVPSEPVPERRLSLEERRAEKKEGAASLSLSSLPYPVYRCTVCGYLMAANNPPHICPICKASKDRFDRFL